MAQISYPTGKKPLVKPAGNPYANIQPAPPVQPTVSMVRPAGPAPIQPNPPLVRYGGPRYSPSAAPAPKPSRLGTSNNPIVLRGSTGQKDTGYQYAPGFNRTTAAAEDLSPRPMGGEAQYEYDKTRSKTRGENMGRAASNFMGPGWSFLDYRDDLGNPDRTTIQNQKFFDFGGKVVSTAASVLSGNPQVALGIDAAAQAANTALHQGYTFPNKAVGSGLLGVTGITAINGLINAYAKKDVVTGLKAIGPLLAQFGAGYVSDAAKSLTGYDVSTFVSEIAAIIGSPKKGLASELFSDKNAKIADDFFGQNNKGITQIDPLQEQLTASNWYSRIERFLEGTKVKSEIPAKWIEMLVADKNQLPKGELKWTGILKYLTDADRTKKIPAEEILKVLRDRRLTIGIEPYMDLASPSDPSRYLTGYQPEDAVKRWPNSGPIGQVMREEEDVRLSSNTNPQYFQKAKNKVEEIIETGQGKIQSAKDRWAFDREIDESYGLGTSGKWRKIESDYEKAKKKYDIRYNAYYGGSLLNLAEEAELSRIYHAIEKSFHDEKYALFGGPATTGYLPYMRADDRDDRKIREFNATVSKNRDLRLEKIKNQNPNYVELMITANDPDYKRRKSETPIEPDGTKNIPNPVYDEEAGTWTDGHANRAAYRLGKNPVGRLGVEPINVEGTPTLWIHEFQGPTYGSGSMPDFLMLDKQGIRILLKQVLMYARASGMKAIQWSNGDTQEGLRSMGLGGSYGQREVGGAQKLYDNMMVNQLNDLIKKSGIKITYKARPDQPSAGLHPFLDISDPNIDKIIDAGFSISQAPQDEKDKNRRIIT